MVKGEIQKGDEILENKQKMTARRMGGEQQAVPLGGEDNWNKCNRSYLRAWRVQVQFITNTAKNTEKRIV